MEDKKMDYRENFRRMFSYENSSDPQKSIELIEQFKKENKELMMLRPEIGIDNIVVDEQGRPCDILSVRVGHEFIFDKSLIPNLYNGYEVIPYLMEDYPDEFPKDETLDKIYKAFPAESYKKFVAANIGSIREKLKAPKITVNEALDVIFAGDFKQYEQWCNEQKNKI